VTVIPSAARDLLLTELKKSRSLVATLLGMTLALHAHALRSTLDALRPSIKDASDFVELPLRLLGANPADVTTRQDPIECLNVRADHVLQLFQLGIQLRGQLAEDGVRGGRRARVPCHDTSP